MFKSCRYLSRVLGVNQAAAWPEPAYPPEVVESSRAIVQWICNRDQDLQVSVDHVWDVCDVWLTTTDNELLSLNQRFFVMNLYLCTLIANPSLNSRSSPQMTDVLAKVLIDAPSVPPRAVAIAILHIRALQNLLVMEFPQYIDEVEVLYIETVLLALSTSKGDIHADRELARRLRKLMADDLYSQILFSNKRISALTSLATNHGMHETSAEVVKMKPFDPDAQ